MIQRVFAILVVACLVASAVAQGGSAARPQGQRGEVRAGGGPRGGGMMGAGLLMMPELQKELALTAAQKASIDKIMKEMQAAASKEGARPNFQQFQTRLMNVLNATQKKRLGQIQLQMRGGSALLDPEVQKQLGITAAQKTKLGQVRDATSKEMRDKMEAARKANKQMDMTAFQNLRKAHDAKFIAVLSAAQKTKWNTMIGKPFAMPAMRGRGR